MFLSSSSVDTPIDVIYRLAIIPVCMHWCMQGYPHPGSGRETAGIPVENEHFSTFSTDFSTEVFHRGVETNMHSAVYIMISTGFDRILIFPRAVFFTTWKIFVQKIPS